MDLDCKSCKHCLWDFSQYCECRKYDNMTEEEIAIYWTNSKSGCLYWEVNNE